MLDGQISKPASGEGGAVEVAYCENCKKHTGHKRNVGVGTALGAVVTGGASLLAVPAYSKRCIICGLTVEQAKELNVTPEQKAIAQADATLGNKILIFGLLLFLVIVFIFITVKG